MTTTTYKQQYKHSYKYTVFSLISVIALGLTVWLLYSSFLPTEHTTANNTVIPDAYMEDVSAIIMNKQGKPHLKINSPKMVHFAENDTTNILMPTLTLYRKSPKPWYVTANHGKATQGIETVVFTDNVAIHHAADENNPATMIKTSELLVHPDKQTAETKDLITLIQPSLIVKSVGMLADLNTGDIKLLSQARGEYVPSP